jgi:hypothetical protein
MNGVTFSHTSCQSAYVFGVVRRRAYVEARHGVLSYMTSVSNVFADKKFHDILLSQRVNKLRPHRFKLLYAININYGNPNR